MDRSVFDTYLEIDRKHFWRRAKRRLVLDLIDRYSPRRRRLQLLDVGAASSLLGTELAKRGEVLLIEPDAPTAELARHELGLQVIEGSLPDALPVTGPFDVITALDVIEHIDDDMAAASALVKRLRPDGLMVVTVPALPWLWSEHDEALHHRRRYLAAGLRAILEGGGLRIGGLSYYTLLLLPLMALTRLPLRKRRETPLGAGYRVKVPATPINAVCTAVMTLERGLMKFTDLPYGACLVAWGRPLNADDRL